MSNIAFNLSSASVFIQPEEFQALEPQVIAAAKMLDYRSGPGALKELWSKGHRNPQGLA